ncbi:hypothetical protein HZ992_14805 [Rhizobacter sp. AJA081-3]|uniref:hypothetical protein n=1 Tax=Rhizobacter sp. AJA081-3 TaxID=2753607 RepID=UPI001ADFEF7F|nr:hypothetical protein [Rhizobacter sp. AJA081-3]QTN21454.1 hypothetical protein HZ992_14805 [Rhizobacter sp. AJA081-3]
MSQPEATALSTAKSWLFRAKLVSIACVAFVLLLANTPLLGEATRFTASAMALAIGAVAFILGIRQAMLIPRLEREAQQLGALPASTQAGKEQVRQEGDA